MINLMFGMIFDKEYPSKIDELNNRYNDKCRITETYSSMRYGDTKLPTARPDFRLKQITWDELEWYIKELNKYNIEFNYTMNGVDIGDLKTFDNNLPDFINSVKRLESIGVKRFTIAHPLIVEIATKHTNVPIELSTIMHIDSLQIIKVWRDISKNIDKICLNLYKNRDIGFVKRMNEVCDKYNMKLEVMANEFCNISGAPCEGIYRDSCYLLHCKNQEENDAKKFGNYPWGRCIVSRGYDSVAWLNAKTIPPNDIIKYKQNTNVNNFKITCRTAPMEFALFLAENYLSCKYDGLLAGLWLHLQGSTIASRKNFERLQKMYDVVPISCQKMSELNEIIYKNSNGEFVKEKMTFFDRYFNDQAYVCDEYEDVDKKDEDLREWEDNYVYKWSKIANLMND
jgi:collagenase-like PrtC family protease